MSCCQWLAVDQKNSSVVLYTKASWLSHYTNWRCFRLLQSQSSSSSGALPSGTSIYISSQTSVPSVLGQFSWWYFSVLDHPAACLSFFLCNHRFFQLYHCLSFHYLTKEPCLFLIVYNVLPFMTFPGNCCSDSGWPEYLQHLFQKPCLCCLQVSSKLMQTQWQN